MTINVIYNIDVQVKTIFKYKWKTVMIFISVFIYKYIIHIYKLSSLAFASKFFKWNADCIERTNVQTVIYYYVLYRLPDLNRAILKLKNLNYKKLLVNALNDFARNYYFHIILQLWIYSKLLDFYGLDLHNLPRSAEITSILYFTPMWKPINSCTAHNTLSFTITMKI